MRSLGCPRPNPYTGLHSPDTFPPHFTIERGIYLGYGNESRLTPTFETFDDADGTDQTWKHRFGRYLADATGQHGFSVM